LHGIILSGVIAATNSIGTTYGRAGPWFRGAVVVLLALAGLAAVFSLLALIDVVRPSPSRVQPRELASHGNYFPQLNANWTSSGGIVVTHPNGPRDARIKELAELSAEAIDGELAIELLRVAVLRRRRHG
jgi:hypothetical protein